MTLAGYNRGGWNRLPVESGLTVPASQTQTPGISIEEHLLITVSQTQSPTATAFSSDVLITASQTQTPAATVRDSALHITVTQTQTPAAGVRDSALHITATQVQSPAVGTVPHFLITATQTHLPGCRETAFLIAVSQTQTPGITFAIVPHTLDEYKWVSLTATASVTAPIRDIQVSIDGLDTPRTFVSFRALLSDHNGVDRTVFLGIIPTVKPTVIPGQNSASCSGYDHGYYLARQFLPNGNVFSGDTYTPATIVKRLLGTDASATDWDKTTGIYPYRIRNPSSTPTDDYVYTSSTTKQQVIADLASLTNCIYLIKPVTVGDWTGPGLYFLPLDDVDDADTGLDLPAAVTFTYPDPYVIGEIRVQQKDETQYNKVTVRSFADDGTVYVDTAYDPGVEDGDVLAIEYVKETRLYDEISIEGTADAILGDLNREVSTYTATLVQRVDLELMQKVKFSGFYGVPDGWMRIVQIKYSGKVADTRVEIQCIPDFDLSDVAAIQRCMSATGYSNMQSIAQSAVNQSPKAIVGTVGTVGTNTCTVTTERGDTMTVRYVE